MIVINGAYVNSSSKNNGRVNQDEQWLFFCKCNKITEDEPVFLSQCIFPTRSSFLQEKVAGAQELEHDFLCLPTFLPPETLIHTSR